MEAEIVWLCLVSAGTESMPVEESLTLNTTFREATQAHLGGIGGFLYENKTDFRSKDNSKEASLIAYGEADG